MASKLPQNITNQNNNLLIPSSLSTESLALLSTDNSSEPEWMGLLCPDVLEGLSGAGLGVQRESSSETLCSSKE